MPGNIIKYATVIYLFEMNLNPVRMRLGFLLDMLLVVKPKVVKPKKYRAYSFKNLVFVFQ